MTMTLAFVLLFTIGAVAVPSGVPAWAVAVLPGGHEYALEVAADDEARSRGYMFRDKVGARDAMLFVFERDERHGIWMKNCRVSLDIVWLDERLRVVHLIENVPPCPADGPCPTQTPPVPARYVLEFAAGTVRAEKLARGQTVVVLSDPPLR